MRTFYFFMQISMRIAAFLVPLCFIGVVIPPTHKGTAVQSEQKTLGFNQVGTASPGAQVFRLMRNHGRGSLVVSRTEKLPDQQSQTTFWGLDPMSHEGVWKVITNVHQMLPAIPLWDGAVDTRGQWEIVHQEAGGAINRLVLQTSAGRKEISSGSVLQSFSRPRFAKLFAGPPQLVTAVADNRVCVALSLDGGKSYPLGDCTEGLLVTTPEGFVFISKRRVPGLVRGNDLSPGRLHATLLGQDLKPSGESVEIGDETVFQFDADVVGSKVVLAATTSQGILLASMEVPSLRFSTRDYIASTSITDPALLPSKSGKPMIFVLEQAGSEHAHISSAVVEIP